jgi:hypothetical protein
MVALALSMGLSSGVASAETEGQPNPWHMPPTRLFVAETLRGLGLGANAENISVTGTWPRSHRTVTLGWSAALGDAQLEGTVEMTYTGYTDGFEGNPGGVLIQSTNPAADALLAKVAERKEAERVAAMTEKERYDAHRAEQAAKFHRMKLLEPEAEEVFRAAMSDKLRAAGIKIAPHALAISERTTTLEEGDEGRFVFSTENRRWFRRAIKTRGTLAREGIGAAAHGSGSSSGPAAPFRWIGGGRVK